MGNGRKQVQPKAVSALLEARTRSRAHLPGRPGGDRHAGLGDKDVRGPGPSEACGSSWVRKGLVHGVRVQSRPCCSGGHTDPKTLGDSEQSLRCSCCISVDRIQGQDRLSFFAIIFPETL